MRMAPPMATAATRTVVSKPMRKNLSTDHWVNGFHLAASSWPRSDRRFRARATRPRMTTTLTTDTIRVIRRPRGPKASATNGAVMGSSLDGQPALEPSGGEPGGEGEQQIGDGAAHEGGDRA